MVSSLQYMHHTDRLIADLFLRRRCTAHQATAYITVPVVNDRLIEPHLETFRVELRSVHVVTEANAVGEPPVAGLGSPISSTVSVREIGIYYTCWLYSLYSLCNFQYRPHDENTCSYNVEW